MHTHRSTLMLLILIVLAGCAPTKQARSVDTSGFLGDLYPLLRHGGEGEALLIYRSSKIASIPRGTYKKILLDRVQVWGEPTTDTLHQAEAQKVADLLYTLAYQSLSQDYEMVTQPGPNTLHIQAAITKAESADVVWRAVSTVPAPMNVFAVASLLKNVGTGKPLFVGDVSVEMKASDGLTGEVLAASVDRRVGKKRIDRDSFDSWDDVHKALDFWVQKARYRLCQERGGSNCVEPKD
ncbi:MAG: hypothetical protein A4S17_14370 [Proteobacteria bacterium HN_bin10]|nr:MAG: hypothetical protein A4S17_14370 [Proteobacteria bacterium HN_bin10]